MKRLLALAGVFLVVPFFISRRSRVVRSTWVQADPAMIFAYLGRPGAWLEWAFPEPPLETAATDTSLTWTTPGGVRHLELLGGAENRHIGYALEIDGHRFEGVVTLVPLGNATRVLWAGWWVGDANPYARYGDLLGRWQTGRMFERGLQRLRALVETQADPFDPTGEDTQWNVA